MCLSSWVSRLQHFLLSAMEYVTKAIPTISRLNSSLYSKESAFCTHYNTLMQQTSKNVFHPHTVKSFLKFVWDCVKRVWKNIFSICAKQKLSYLVILRVFFLTFLFYKWQKYIFGKSLKMNFCQKYFLS